MKKIVSLISIFILGFILVACNRTGKETYYTVTFDVDGGSLVESVEVLENTEIGILPTTEKKEFVFGGWFTDAEKTIEAKTTLVITADITLYAKWDEAALAVSFQDAIDKLDAKNHQIDIGLYYYNQLQASIMLKFDGNKSMYQEGLYIEEYYIRDNRNLTTYEKTQAGFKETTVRAPKDEKFIVFSKLEESWFESNDKDAKKYELLEAHYESLMALFTIGEGYEINGAELNFDESNQISKAIFRFTNDRLNYSIEMNFSNYGSTVIELPEVIS